MELTDKEKKVLSALASGPWRIREIARRKFPGVRPVAKADSWVRNSLRRLVSGGLVKKVSRGTYDRC